MSFNPYFPGVTFQSLRCVIELLNLFCFNPYFPGVTFQRQPFAVQEVVLLVFQSLFSWSYLSKFSFSISLIRNIPVSILIFLELPFKESRDAFLPCLINRFNPYFPGVTFQRPPASSHARGGSRFQSLFSWSYLSKMSSCRRSRWGG